MSHWDFRPPADDAAPPRPRRTRRERGPDPASGDAWPVDPRASRTTAWYSPPGPDDEPDESWDDDGQDTALYPLTYERDPFVHAVPEPPAASPRARQPWPRAPRPDGLIAPALTFGTAGDGTAGDGTAGPPPSSDYLTEEADYLAEEWAALPGGQGRDDERAPGAPRRWLLPAGVAAAGIAVGACAVLLFGGHPGSKAAGNGSAGAQRAGAPAAAGAARPSATASRAPSAAATAAAGPLTSAEAQSVLAAYSATNNTANSRFDSALLATIETGSSDAIDTALYQGQQAAKAPPYPAFSAAQAFYYIPGDEPATGPRWFVVQVANAFSSSPAKVANTEYLLFTQATPGGAWQDAIEPYILSAGSAPRVAVGSDGLATAVSADSTSAAVAPGQLPAVTAASLDAASGQATVTRPGNLADFAKAKKWRAKFQGASVTDTHAVAAGTDGQEFALRTSDGGALVFYTDAATVTATAQAGMVLAVNVPGFFSPGQPVSQAVLDYQEQFAAYDPPAGQGAPRVVADYSGITGKG